MMATRSPPSKVAVKPFRICGPPFVAEHHVLQLDRLTVQLLLGVVLEAYPRVLTRARLEFLDLDLVDHLQARGGLLGLGRIGREAAHEALQVGHAFLRLCVGSGHALARLRRRLDVVVPGARIDADGRVVQVGHVGAHLIQEVAVVADDDHRAVAFVQHVFEPADGVDVEVVGRLVEQQHVRIGEQRLAQQHAQLPAGCDFAHRAGVLFGRNADAEQQFSGACFGGVAVVLGELALQFGRAHVVLFRRVRVGVDGILLLHALPHFCMTHHHDVDDTQVFECELVLTQECHALMRVERHIAGGRFEHAGENLHEGRFAGAVGTDQAVAVAAAELDADVVEQRFGTELHGDVGSGQHGTHG
jgi:hypothetical protein